MDMKERVLLTYLITSGSSSSRFCRKIGVDERAEGWGWGAMVEPKRDG
jgi:hypothetical protein